MALRWLLSLSFFIAGIVHLRLPEPFLAITPDWVPYPRDVIYLTGLCEIAGAIALLTRGLRKPAGIMLAIYAICVYPANVKHAFEHVAIHGTALGWWYHAPRLALQPVIIWWALFAGEVIDWPATAAGAGNARGHDDEDDKAFPFEHSGRK